MHVRLISLLIALTLALLVVTPEGQGSSAESVTCSTKVVIRDSKQAIVNLTGKWLGNDKGTYWVRQIGSCVWWSGSGLGFSNVFFGTMTSSGSTVFGLWADVPEGATVGSGSLILSVRSPGRQLAARGSTGGFAGKSWTKAP